MIKNESRKGFLQSLFICCFCCWLTGSSLAENLFYLLARLSNQSNGICTFANHIYGSSSKAVCLQESVSFNHIIVECMEWMAVWQDPLQERRAIICGELKWEIIIFSQRASSSLFPSLPRHQLYRGLLILKYTHYIITAYLQIIAKVLLITPLLLLLQSGEDKSSFSLSLNLVLRSNSSAKCYFDSAASASSSFALQWDTFFRYPPLLQIYVYV